MRRVGTVVVEEGFRDIGGAPRFGVPGMLASFFGMGESLLVDRAEGPRPVLVSLSPYTYVRLTDHHLSPSFSLILLLSQICFQELEMVHLISIHLLSASVPELGIVDVRRAMLLVGGGKLMRHRISLR